MKDNFRTLTSGILAKVSSLYAKKDNVYSKKDTYSKDEVDESVGVVEKSINDLNQEFESHKHPYLKYRNFGNLPDSAEYWNSIAYGDGRFVALSSRTKYAAYTGDDGGWLEATLPSSSDWCSVAYGNGKFVAIKGDRYAYKEVAYSKDGINWKEYNLPIYSVWTSVTYGNGKFVIVSKSSAGGSNETVYSEDGITWFSSTLPSTQVWTSVTYGNGKFVAVAGSGTYSSNKVAYSEDGINWNESTLSNSGYWQSVTYGNGKFVAVGINSNIAIYSEDGINWNETPLLRIADDWTSVTYGDGKYVAVANDTNIAAYSEDGINWNESTLPNSGYWKSVIYGNGKFVAITNSSNIIAYSHDGITWTSSYNELAQDNIPIVINQINDHDHSYIHYRKVTKLMPELDSWYVISYLNDRFIAFSGKNTDIAAYSYDGITWSTIKLPFTGRWISIVYVNNRYIAFSRNPVSLAHSTDGITWTELESSSFTTSINNIAYGNGKYVGSGYYQFANSIDGNNWTYNPSDFSPGQLIYGSDKFIVVSNHTGTGSYAGIYYSNDGSSWSKASTPTLTNTNEYWKSVAYGDGKYAAITDYGNTIAYSEDGIEWTQATSPSSSTVWNFITYGNGKFVAIGYDKAIYSEDGISWSEVTLPIYFQWYGMAYGDNKFVAVSTTDQVIYSKDGINWEVAYIPELVQDGDVITLEELGLSGNNNGTSFDYTETDPTVPDWAKEPTKPTYTASEISVSEDLATSAGAADNNTEAMLTTLTNGFTWLNNTALPRKQDKLTGVASQIVGFDANGNAVAQTKPTYTASEVGAATFDHTHNKYATKNNPEFSGSISLNRQSGTTVGDCSVAEGYHATASGNYSHSEGFVTTASGNYSHAEGYSTEASGSSSHTEGYWTKASGHSSHAEGSSTIASGYSSHAEGDHTTANSMSQHVQGEYNILDIENTTGRGAYAHIVGNGRSANARSNAHTLDWYGNAWFAGDIYVGSTSGTNKDEGSKILATQDYVDIRVPAWTEADEGKVLRIVNGVPTWATIANAEGSSY